MKTLTPNQVTHNANATARKLLDNLGPDEHITGQTLHRSTPPKKDEEEPVPDKSKQSGTTFFMKKPADPKRPMSKYNRPKSTFKPEPLLGESLARRVTGSK